MNYKHNKKIKLAFVEYSNIFSGAEMSLHSLVKYLDSSSFESTIYFRYPLEHQERYNDLSCKKSYLTDQKKWWMGSDYWKKPIKGSDFLKRFIFGFKLAMRAKKENIDIIHINILRPDSLLWVLLPHLFGIKVIAHSRSDSMSWIPVPYIQKQCDAIICVSDFVKEKVVSKYAASPAYTVYDPVDYNHYTQVMSKREALKDLNINNKQKLLSSVGLLSAHKGHDMSIRVFSNIAKKYSEYILMIAGGGNDNELQRLKKLALERGVENRVIFTEKQIANVATVYRASEIVFSLTTRGEAFGRVPFEGNACDTAVIAPSKGAAIELITDDKTGFLVDPLDEKAITKRVLSILENPVQTKNIVQQGKEYFSDFLSPLHSAKEVEKVYHAILKSNDK